MHGNTHTLTFKLKIDRGGGVCVERIAVKAEKYSAKQQVPCFQRGLRIGPDSHSLKCLFF